MGTTLRLLPLATNGPAAYFFLIAAILVLIITFMIRLIRYQTRQKRAGGRRDPGRPREQDKPPLRAGAPEEIVRWEVQMQELARDLKAEIDSKAAVLSQLIREADRAARRLEAHLPRESTAAPHGPEWLDDSSSAAAPPSDQSSSVREEIYMLADYGFLLEDIAGRVDMPIGEVELILQLREKKG